MHYPNLSKEMDKRNLSDEDIAKLIDRTPSAVYKRRSGVSGCFPVEEAVRIHKKLFPECDFSYLFYSNKEELTE